VKRAREAAHRDLQDGLQREVHVEGVPELEEGRELRQAAARLLELHLVDEHAAPDPIDLRLLADHEQAVDGGETHQSD
jgi:hypothetical protein